MPAIPIAVAAASAYSSIKGADTARKAANQAADAAKNGGVNIPQVAQQAQDQALKNIALSRQVEQQYDPQNAALRSGSVTALQGALGNIGNNSDSISFINRAAGNGGGTYAGPAAGQPLTAEQASSGLLSDAVRKAQSDLALGGQLPQDVRNLVARQAAATSGSVSGGGIGLGHDIGLRDLGLTSLQLQQQRLQNAQSLGQADLGANQFNAQGRYAAQVGNLGARQFDTSQRQQASQFDAGNNLNIAQLLASLHSNDFSKYLAAAQFGQQLQSPTVGLDPSAIANLAVGNSNVQQSGAQNAAAIAGANGSGMAQLGGQGLGYALSQYGQQYGMGYQAKQPQTNNLPTATQMINSKNIFG